ncbi:MAG: ArsR/SmtB family transcription factor [Fimbriimonadaceae bacterium]
MEKSEIAPMLRALGEPTRLAVFSTLLRCNKPIAVESDGGIRAVQGQTVSEICCHVGEGERPTSRMTFHLKELRSAGLIETEKLGRNVVCRVRPEAVALLAAFFTESERCCAQGCCA